MSLSVGARPDLDVDPGRAGRLLEFPRRYPLVVATLAVGAVVVGLLAAGQPVPAQWLGSGWALAVAVRVAWGMVEDVLAGHWGVDLLAVTAISSTVAVGEYLASLVVVLMLTGGQALEDYAANRARKELNALLERAPVLAHRLRPDGSVQDVPVEEVRPGDEILVRPAEVVPVDGRLVGAEADFDESSITGESLPVTRRAGDAVLSGVLNEQQAVVLRATATAADSQYATIVAMVREAAASRAPVVRLADRYAVPFTAFALLVAGLAWWYHGDPVVFAEVLVVATPCPLLIAAPVAFLGGMSRAARNGVIIKNAGTLERLAAVRTAAFDKTGTITYGRPELLAVHARPPVPGGRAAAPDGLPSSTPRTCSRPRCGTPRSPGGWSRSSRRRRTRRPPTVSPPPSRGAGWWSAGAPTWPAPPRTWSSSRSAPASWPCTWPWTAVSPAPW